MNDAGPLALVGGSEWTEGCTFDAELLKASGADEVVVLPTASAYEWPDRKVSAAQDYFAQLGASVRGVNILHRRDAGDADALATIRAAKFLYLADGSPLHLRSVLKDTPLWDAIVAAWRSGAVLAASSAAATVLGDPMVDPRGGAFTLGLGLVPNVAIVPNWKHWTIDKERRLTQLMPKHALGAEIEERTALIRWSAGKWAISGVGSVTLELEGQTVGLEALADR